MCIMYAIFEVLKSICENGMKTWLFKLLSMLLYKMI